MIKDIVTIIICVCAFALSAVSAFIILTEIKTIERFAKPKLPKNIGVYAGRYLIGECPKCEHSLTNCDGQQVSGISYCPCCGTKIRFPYCTPQMYGVKSVPLEEYSKEGKK